MNWSKKALNGCATCKQPLKLCQSTYLCLFKDGSLLVFAPLVLEPDPDDPGGQPGHLDQLLLHEGVGPWVGLIAALHHAQLFFCQHCPHAASPAPAAVGRRPAAAATLAAAAG